MVGSTRLHGSLLTGKLGGILRNRLVSFLVQGADKTAAPIVLITSEVTWRRFPLRDGGCCTVCKPEHHIWWVIVHGKPANMLRRSIFGLSGVVTGLMYACVVFVGPDSKYWLQVGA